MHMGEKTYMALLREAGDKVARKEGRCAKSCVCSCTPHTRACWACSQRAPRRLSVSVENKLRPPSPRHLRTFRSKDDVSQV